MQRSHNAFTLIELLIVVIILGMIAGFGIPNYNRSRARIDERDAANNLSTIASAMEMYTVRNDGAYPLTASIIDVDAINTTLNLGIIEQRMTFGCISDGIAFTCTSTAAPPYNPVWSLNVRDTDEGNPRCSAGTCPTCVPGGC